MLEGGLTLRKQVDLEERVTALERRGAALSTNGRTHVQHRAAH